MSGQLRYVQSYAAMVDANLAAFPEDEAFALSVGGHFERFGILEYRLLRQLGLLDSHHVVDVGCGAGRLACKLAAVPGLRYTGTDVVPKLLEYAKRKSARPDFTFRFVDRIEIPAPDQSADFITFFSVFTHLLHEESYVYLEEAARVLKPGGKIVFSFLEFAVAHNWGVFLSNVDWVRKRTYLGHINVFIHADDIRIWAEKVGLHVAAMYRGDDCFIEVDAAHAAEELPPGHHAMGQSVCVLTKA